VFKRNCKLSPTKTQSPNRSECVKTCIRRTKETQLGNWWDTGEEERGGGLLRGRRTETKGGKVNGRETGRGRKTTSSAPSRSAANASSKRHLDVCRAAPKARTESNLRRCGKERCHKHEAREPRVGDEPLLVPVPTEKTPHNRLRTHSTHSQPRNEPIEKQRGDQGPHEEAQPRANRTPLKN
jgi:hypothetical protein